MEFKTRSKAKKQTNISYLSSINSSSKIKKNGKHGMYTFVLYLAPSKLSGYNTCPMATKECINGCLNTSGRTIIDNKNTIQNARINKTKLYFEHREFFMKWLVAEIQAAKQKSIKDNMEFSVRLNGTSDIDWSIPKLDGKNIYQIFPDVQFYEYTKVYKRVLSDILNNLHLTFSYTGENWKWCEIALKKSINVAVVFSNDNFPKYWNDYKVIDGNKTDYRSNDEIGVIVGLPFKKIKDKNKMNEVLNSKFVVNID